MGEPMGTIKYSEIFKLKDLLEQANIPYQYIDRTQPGAPSPMPFEFYQIKYLGHETESICSVIEGRGTYGAEQDLLEIMGLLTPEEAQHDNVCGGLTAEEVFGRIKEHWEATQ